MALTHAEFDAILSDVSKHIDGDLDWMEDEDHSPAVVFRAEVQNEAGYPLFISGSFNREAKALTFSLILKTEGRIYGLDLGKDHRNPDRELVGETHKHRWTEKYRDKEAYSPRDITATIDDPVRVWQQFCAEAKIEHRGKMSPPPPIQGRLWE